MGITKEALLAMVDSANRTVPVGNNGDGIVIRRLKLKERNTLLKGRKPDDPDSAAELSKQLIVAAVVEPALTAEDLDELPAALVDELAKQIMDLNGWTKEGQAQIADHFRPAP